jgi:methylase of polypeptide subunit release factors
MILSGVNADFTGSDISPMMINSAKKNLEGQRVDLFVADGFRLPLKPEIKFDLIHIDSVLHHLIAKTRPKSLCLANQFLNILANFLSSNGILIVEEMYYDSYLIPYVTSSIVFYSLKLLNFVNLDISKLKNDVKLGLEVNFFYDKQLRRILERYGVVHVIRKIPSKLSKLQRILLLEERGIISYMIIAQPPLTAIK